MKITQIVDVNNFDYTIIRDSKRLSRRRGNPGTTNKWYYKDLVCAFDIETTYLKDIDRSFMYVWQFQVDEYATVMGRTWQEYQQFIKGICKYLSSDERLYIGVHNLSFEWQYLRGIYDFTTKDLFCIKPRKILTARSMDNRIEYHCTYLHSNMSLAKYCEKMNTDHGKESGEEFDYSIIRYPWTPLTDKEIRYCQMDVLALVEAIKNDMANAGDTLYTFPATSTGYVRRDVRKACKEGYVDISNILPDYTTYQYCREAFRGGNTHANRYYTGRIIKNVKSYDRKSSYPEVIMNKLYPMTKFEELENPTMEDVVRLMELRSKALLVRIKIWNIELRNMYWPVPYLSDSKCRHVKNKILDNGRILSAEYLETTLTDIDLRIMLEEYKWTHCEIEGCLVAGYGPLPEPIRNCTIDYFRKKSTLDGVSGEEYYYFKSKEMLNAIYGMFAQDPVKQDILFENNEFSESELDEESILIKNNKRAFLAYQWGVWVTAWARLELEQGIKIAGENTIYVDTDSVKYIDNGAISWTTYNKEKKAESIAHNAYADANSKRFILGVFEHDGTYKRFVTMGAKKYAYEDSNGELHVTVSGVRKKEGAKDLEKEGGIESFKEGFVFEHGGSEARYCDDIQPHILNVDGHQLLVTSCVSIIPHQYELGLSGDYKRLLDGIQLVQ